MGLLLAIETSCDETGVAILRDHSELLAGEVSSQIDLHARYGGVVPEIASRNHLLATPALVDRAVLAAGIELAEIDGFAATLGPGLAAALLVGVGYAKGLAIASNRPFLGVNHLEGHLLSPFFGEPHISAHVGLIVSGGHTMLVEVEGFGEYRVLGTTRDDAAGEAFDKVAKLMGLPYPGGPAIDEAAAGGDPTRYPFPRALPGSAEFSFSGLKTSVRYFLEKEKSPCVADLAASFQEAVVDSLVSKSIAAARASGKSCFAMSGGVSANRRLSSKITAACAANGIECRIAPPRLSTDNAAMIAYAAACRPTGSGDPISVDVFPNFVGF